MKTKSILEKSLKNKNIHWDDKTTIDVLCSYIDRQLSPELFAHYVEPIVEKDAITLQAIELQEKTINPTPAAWVVAMQKLAESFKS